MKEIKAFIRPTRIRDVSKALRTTGYCCMTLTECEGTGLYSDPEREFPSFKFPFMHSKMVKIEIVAPDGDVNDIVRIIQENGRTGHRGDGIIYEMDVNHVYKVRNGEISTELNKEHK